MMKFILVLVVVAMATVVARMALIKAGLLRPRKRDPARSAAMAQLKRELDIILWIPPALIVLGGAWAIGVALYSWLSN